jgi:hypothetical protein
MDHDLQKVAMVPHPTCSREEWIERFAARFRESRPWISHEQAVDVASAAFTTANDIEPEEAAVVFGEIVDARVPLDDLTRWLR